MVLHVFTSLLGGLPSCIPLGLYDGTPLGGTTQGTLEGYTGRVLSHILARTGLHFQTQFFTPTPSLSSYHLPEVRLQLWLFFIGFQIMPTS